MGIPSIGNQESSDVVRNFGLVGKFSIDGVVRRLNELARGESLNVVAQISSAIREQQVGVRHIMWSPCGGSYRQSTAWRIASICYSQGTRREGGASFRVPQLRRSRHRGHH